MFGCDSAAAARTLALEAAHGVGVVEPLLADELEGDDAAELPVAGLEDLAHAALAEPLQQDIGAEKKFLAAALEELVGLVGGQPVAADQLAGQGFGIGKARLQRRQFVQLRRLQQPVLSQGVHQGHGRNDGHAHHRERMTTVKLLNTQQFYPVAPSFAITSSPPNAAARTARAPTNRPAALSTWEVVPDCLPFRANGPNDTG